MRYSSVLFLCVNQANYPFCAGAELSAEYGKDCLQMHCDAIKPGEKVLVVDDLLATGGTVEATIKMIRQAGGIG